LLTLFPSFYNSLGIFFFPSKQLSTHTSTQTDLCAFSEYRIYPGHGQKYVRRDGQLLNISTGKCMSMVHQGKKSQKLMWTQAWRRLNKKGKDEGISKKKSRKTVRVQRAVMGVTVEELKAKRQATKPKSVATEAALKEVKDRKKAAKGGAAAGGAPKAIIPKIQRSAQDARGGAKR
jgi:large subunit ribosomal protein L24e